MNILVSPYRNGSFYFRSDSTMIRALTDFYIPDYIDSISAVPILCIRSERSGKSVAAKFADRYLGPFTCGLIIKPCLHEEAVLPEDRVFVKNALDYSTVIPYDLLPADRLEGFISGQRPVRLMVNGIAKASVSATPDKKWLHSRFAGISRYCSLRTGDFLAFELADAVPVQKDSRLTMTFGVEGNISIVIH